MRASIGRPPMSWFGNDPKLPQNDAKEERVEDLQAARDEYVVDEHKPLG